jgi:hypothetical protein
MPRDAEFASRLAAVVKARKIVPGPRRRRAKIIPNTGAIAGIPVLDSGNIRLKYPGIYI